MIIGLNDARAGFQINHFFLMVSQIAHFVTGHQLGIEMAVILLIFTGQVWNLAFSFYSSLIKTIPREMLEASRSPLPGWQRFWQLEMPFSAIGLVWNSIISVAGGSLRAPSFAKPSTTWAMGIFSSPAWAATSPRPRPTATRALLAGIAAVILIVKETATDRLSMAAAHHLSNKLSLSRGSRPIRSLRPSSHSCAAPRLFKLCRGASGIASRSRSIAIWRKARSAAWCGRSMSWPGNPLRFCGRWQWRVGIGAVGRTGHAPARTVTWADLRLLLEGAAATFLRVNVSLIISAASTVL